MSFAVLTAVDLGTVQVDIVCEAHDGRHKNFVPFCDYA